MMLTFIQLAHMFDATQVHRVLADVNVYPMISNVHTWRMLHSTPSFDSFSCSRACVLYGSTCYSGDVIYFSLVLHTCLMPCRDILLVS